MSVPNSTERNPVDLYPISACTELPQGVIKHTDGKLSPKHFYPYGLEKQLKKVGKTVVERDLSLEGVKGFRIHTSRTSGLGHGAVIQITVNGIDKSGSKEKDLKDAKAWIATKYVQELYNSTKTELDKDPDLLGDAVQDSDFPDESTIKNDPIEALYRILPAANPSLAYANRAALAERAAGSVLSSLSKICASNSSSINDLTLAKVILGLLDSNKDRNVVIKSDYDKKLYLYYSFTSSTLTAVSGEVTEGNSPYRKGTIISLLNESSEGVKDQKFSDGTIGMDKVPALKL